MDIKKALIIGIDDYVHNKLHCCVNDATTLNKLIMRNEDNSPNFDCKLEINVGSRARLRSLIREVFSGYSDVALLYFSGHGFINEQDGYILALDTRRYDEGISMSEILDEANRSRAKNKVIILDCCYSGAIGALLNARPHAPHVSPGTTILTASRQDEVAVEVNGHGMFTNLLLEALKGGAADIRGHITPGSIYAYIDRALGTWNQRPEFKTNVSQFISLRNVAPQISLDILRGLTDYFPEPTDEFALDPSYEDSNVENPPHLVRKPFAIKENTGIFKHLQKLYRIGLVTPVGEDYMYFAAMNSKSCRLTPLGNHYWRLAKNGKI